MRASRVGMQGQAVLDPIRSLLLHLPFPITLGAHPGCFQWVPPTPHHPMAKRPGGWGPQGMVALLSLTAPEVVGRQRYGRPVDCWAIGVIMYIL